MKGAYRKDNTVFIHGEFSVVDLRRPLVALHKIVAELGYRDLTIDFSDCSAAFPAPMLGLCAQVMKLREGGVDIGFSWPRDERLWRLFKNANWAHLLDPSAHDPSTFKGHTQVPATQYRTADDQRRATNRIVNAILGAIQNIERSDFAALEWALNEITDNVLVHAESPIGGLVQVSTFQRLRKRVQFIVADCGFGIPNTLRQGKPEITSDVDALDKAIREGVTRNVNIGQGNGLFGSFQICSQSNGFFEIASGWATLVYRDGPGLRIQPEPSPYDGTLVVMELDFSNPRLLGEALKFGGKVHRPYADFVEKTYEELEGEDVIFRIANESDSFGSRVAGTPLRTKLVNLMKMCPDQRIIIDFSDVPLISSSFADELIGKLFLELGPIIFMNRFKIRSVSQIVQMLLDKAIAQRMRQ